MTLGASGVQGADIAPCYREQYYGRQLPKAVDQGARVGLCKACEVGSLLSSLGSREPLTSQRGSGLLSPSGLGSLLSACEAKGSFFSAQGV